jgi:FtsP/CotA-like multicopper oxidase with cupredoxin domain
MTRHPKLLVSKIRNKSAPEAFMLSRRSFLSGTLAIGAASRLRAETGDAASTVLRIERRDIEVNGKSASVLCIRQPDGTIGITTDVGKPFRVRVENHIEEPSLLHWHGLTPPWQQDGVPGMSGPASPPGGFQEQLLLSAPLIIRDGGETSGGQDIVIELADFSFTPPEQIFAQLQSRQTHDMEMLGMTMQDMNMQEMKMQDMGMTAKSGAPDLNDVQYDAFLANGRTLEDPEVIKVEPGGRVRLRIINASSMSAYHIDLGELTGHLVAVDGIPVQPVHGRTFPIAAAQRLDIELAVPKSAAAYPVLAVLEGRAPGWGGTSDPPVRPGGDGIAATHPRS